MDIFKDRSYTILTGYKVWESKESDTILAEADGEEFVFLWVAESRAVARSMLLLSAVASVMLIL